MFFQRTIVVFGYIDVIWTTNVQLKIYIKSNQYIIVTHKARKGLSIILMLQNIKWKRPEFSGLEVVIKISQSISGRNEGEYGCVLSFIAG